MARGEATNESDIDILVDLDANRRVSVFGLIAIEQSLEMLAEAEKMYRISSRRGIPKYHGANYRTWATLTVTRIFG